MLAGEVSIMEDLGLNNTISMKETMKGNRHNVFSERYMRKAAREGAVQAVATKAVSM